MKNQPVPDSSFDIKMSVPTISIAEKLFGEESPEVQAEGAIAEPPRLRGNRRRSARALETISSKASDILNSEDDNEEDEDGDDCQVVSIEAPQGSSMRFNYQPRDYIEYSIAIKSATDLCSTFDYFNAHEDVYHLQTDYNVQQVCCLNGSAITKIGKHIVSIHLSFNPESQRFSVTIHSYDREAARETARQFRKLCRKGNFYKKKHLQANSFEREPLTFQPPPMTQTIYGFEKEYSSIRTNSLGFFKMTDIHRLCAQRGVLLFGRPGSGKSLIVSQIKRECLENGITVVDMSMAAMHAVRQWYDKIEHWLSPCLVVMEDLDIIGESREMNKPVQAITTDLLNSLSGSRKHRSVIVTMATTNRIDVLDSALTRARRMDVRYAINGLNPSFKKQLFRSYFEPVEILYNDDTLDKATHLLGDDATGADVSSISVSTLIHIKDGKNKLESFDLSLAEWKEAHAIKTANSGFRPSEDA